MDIEVAVASTLKSLTLGEKALGQALLQSQRLYGSATEVGTVWLRAPKIGLSDALKTAREMALGRKTLLKFIHIFCDTLTIQSGDSIDSTATNTPSDASKAGDGSFSIQIYARRIIAPAAGDKASLRVEMVPSSTLVFWTPEISKTFEFDLSVKTKGSVSRMKPAVEEPNFGIAYTCAPSGDIRTSQLPPTKAALVNINYLDLIREDGSIQDQGYQNDELPRLLNMQLLVAQVYAEDDPGFAIELLNFVIVASGTSSSYQLHYAALGLRNNLALGKDLVQASSVNIYAAKQVLKARLAAAMAFETAYRDFLLESGNAKQQTASSLNLLAKSSDALETYKFIINIRQREYDTAVSSNDKAKANFEKSNSDIETKSKIFQEGVEKYKKEQEKEARKSILKGIFSCILAVGATVATGGAAAPSIAAAGAGIVSSVEKTASIIQKLKAVYDKLKALYEKIKPVLEKLSEIVETSKKMIEMINKLKKDGETTDNAKALRPSKDAAEVSDVGIAEWQKFNITVLDMQDYMRDYDIDGKREYFMALRTLVVYGECFIKTQANLVQKSDDLAFVSFQRKMEDKDQKRLAAMTYSAVTNEKILDLLKRAMFDRVLSLRSFVYQDFRTYALAYNYHSLSTKPLLKMSPVKPVVDYLEDAAVIQGAVVAYGSRMLIQARQFRLESLGGYGSASELGTALAQSGSVQCTVDPQDPIWRGFSRIRMSSVRCYLNGIKSSTASQTVKLLLSTDGRFFDRDCFQKDADKQLVPVRSFVGDPRTLLFEYNPQSKAIIADGLYGQERDYTKHTPIASWAISIADYVNADDESSRQQYDFTGVTGITMEFGCDVVWTGW